MVERTKKENGKKPHHQLELVGNDGIRMCKVCAVKVYKGDQPEVSQ